MAENFSPFADIAMAGRDAVVPFAVAPLDVRGRAVQVGPMLDTMLARHDYPVAVSKLLAEAVTLTVLLGTTLKFDGKFILQTQTDGPVSMIVTDFTTPHGVRAYARFDEDKLSAVLKDGEADAPTLLGKGILAMTIDQGAHMQRYQGIVQLDGISLEEVARRYFRQSEQIPTEIRLAVGEVFTRQEGEAPKRSWSAGGVLLQFLPENEERMRQRDLDGGDGSTEGEAANSDDAWAEASALIGTVSDVELTDETVEVERLLFRLFHEHGVRVFDATQVRDECGCSREKVENVLNGLSPEERAESVELAPDGKPRIQVKCEFCSTEYNFDPAEFDTVH
ncbi:MAG: Hsp33 family molecular chaperone [Pseudomonadota bacterium]